MGSSDHHHYGPLSPSSGCMNQDAQHEPITGHPGPYPSKSNHKPLCTPSHCSTSHRQPDSTHLKGSASAHSRARTSPFLSRQVNDQSRAITSVAYSTYRKLSFAKARIGEHVRRSQATAGGCLHLHNVAVSSLPLFSSSMKILTA